jgi:peptidoglycan/LPS O-acetylase OafA/YrhL
VCGFWSRVVRGFGTTPGSERGVVADGEGQGVEVEAESRYGHTLGTSFQPKRNSLNFLRVALAVAVVFSHSITVGGYGSEVLLGKTTLGTVAVYGFFGLSGYLIAGSAERNGTGQYLWQRILRIFPGFWACLVVTAFGFGVIAWYQRNPSLARSCGFHCYVDEPGGPLGYVFHNAWLKINQAGIAGTLAPGFLRDAWNGSLWTLFFEFLCYLLLAGLALAGLLRRRFVVLVSTLTVWAAEIAVTAVPGLNQHFSALNNWYPMKMLTFVPIFLGGSLLYLYRNEIRDSGRVALLCTLLFLMGLVLPIGAGIPTFTLTSMDVTAVFLAYPLLWLGIHLPLSKVGARNDYSYGIYIYAFPVQQILVVWGVSAWGYWTYTFVTLVCVVPVAAGSWWLVEKNALSLKRLRPMVAFGRRA